MGADPEQHDGDARVGGTGCARRQRTSRWVPLAACLAALGYTGAKGVLAVRGELGLPGFPAPARPGVDPWTGQLGNAGLGVLGALLALAALRQWRRRVQIALAVALGLAALLETVGAAVLVARTLRLTTSYAALPPGPGPYLGAGYAVLTATLFGATAGLAARRR